MLYQLPLISQPRRWVRCPMQGQDVVQIDLSTVRRWIRASRPQEIERNRVGIIHAVRDMRVACVTSVSQVL